MRLCVHIKLIYDNFKTSCVCALAVSNINYYRNFIEYRHESVELVWCDSCTCGVTKEEQIIQSGYFNCIVNWNVKSIVLRERITPVEQYSTKGCSLHIWHSCVGTKPRHPGLHSVLTLLPPAVDVLTQDLREGLFNFLLYNSILLVYYISIS